MANLNFQFRPINKELAMALAQLNGVIDGQTIPTFQSTLDDYLKQGIKRLILDMSKISYVNSTGLGCLVKYAELFENAGGGLALLSLPPKVRIVIDMLGLKGFFSICESLPDAQQALGGPQPQKVERAKVEKPELRKKKEQKVTPVRAESKPSGPVSFPHFVNCQSCSVKLEFHKEGSYKCPRCHTAIQLDSKTGPRFTKPTGDSALSLSLPARAECGEGLLHLATTVCAAKFRGPALDALRISVHEVVQVIQNYCYADDPNGMYHVAIDFHGSQAEIRIADHGAPVDTTRLPISFPQATRYMDSFECIAHPKGGNLIRMTKTGS